MYSVIIKSKSGLYVSRIANLTLVVSRKIMQRVHVIGSELMLKGKLNSTPKNVYDSHTGVLIRLYASVSLSV